MGSSIIGFIADSHAVFRSNNPPTQPKIWNYYADNIFVIIRNAF